MITVSEQVKCIIAQLAGIQGHPVPITRLGTNDKPRPVFHEELEGRWGGGVVNIGDVNDHVHGREANLRDICSEVSIRFRAKAREAGLEVVHGKAGIQFRTNVGPYVSDVRELSERAGEWVKETYDIGGLVAHNEEAGGHTEEVAGGKNLEIESEAELLEYVADAPARPRLEQRKPVAGAEAGIQAAALTRILSEHPPGLAHSSEADILRNVEGKEPDGDFLDEVGRHVGPVPPFGHFLMAGGTLADRRGVKLTGRKATPRPAGGPRGCTGAQTQSLPLLRVARSGERNISRTPETLTPSRHHPLRYRMRP